MDDGKHKNSIPVLDGVRGIACLSIITFHMNLIARFNGIWTPALDGPGAFASAASLFGEAGVILFFVLSGFLLFLPYCRAMLTDTPWPSVRRFYLRRAFRIFPGYYVALFLMLIFLSPEYLNWSHLHAVWLFITFRMDFPLTFQLVNAPFWTLALEFQYYLVLPWLALAIACLVRRGKQRGRLIKLAGCLLLLFVYGVGTRYWMIVLGGEGPLSQIFSPFWLEQLKLYSYGSVGKDYEVFASGMLVAGIYSYTHIIAPIGRLSHLIRRLSPFLFLLGLTLLYMISLWHFYLLFPGKTLHFLDPYKESLYYYKDIFQPLLYGISFALCIQGLLYGATWLKRPFEWGPLRWTGLISYSLYIWHYSICLLFIGYCLPRFQPLNWGQPALFTVDWLWILITAFPLSIVLYKVVEIPGMRLGEKICKRFERPKKYAPGTEEPLPAEVAARGHQSIAVDNKA
ncbi:hypothetical protein KDK_31080 [Dictyobacter kobayashii]|uniref:Acyltransferase 3 domain-containing protein n=1 Tax=Dictyobacter kobayashii TaxID=2014872 RepID=A0A402AJF4_9CHLR|nr:hypothetical protein KDK_31080 [Dictyobacter kobayashii]